MCSFDAAGRNVEVAFCFDTTGSMYSCLDTVSRIREISIMAVVLICSLTLSALQAETTLFANSVDPDEMAHNEPSHQDLHCLPFCFDFD